MEGRTKPARLLFLRKWQCSNGSGFRARLNSAADLRYKSCTKINYVNIYIYIYIYIYIHMYMYNNIL